MQTLKLKKECKKSIHEKQADKLKEKRMKSIKRINRVYRIQENVKEKKRKSKVKEKTNALKNAMDRISRFKKAVRYGPIFPCCSCEQMMFENGVMQISKDIIKSVKSACDKTDTDLFCKVFGEKLKESSFGVALDGKITHYFLCYTCKKHLLGGKLPPMAAGNGLKLRLIPKDLILTELENNLIARRILFKKIYQLPKSRIASLKDKIINIPIGEEDIDNTLEMLPRTPTEGGLVEIQLKRKKRLQNPL